MSGLSACHTVHDFPETTDVMDCMTCIEGWSYLDYKTCFGMAVYGEWDPLGSCHTVILVDTFLFNRYERIKDDLQIRNQCESHDMSWLLKSDPSWQESSWPEFTQFDPSWFALTLVDQIIVVLILDLIWPELTGWPEFTSIANPSELICSRVFVFHVNSNSSHHRSLVFSLYSVVTD